MGKLSVRPPVKRRSFESPPKGVREAAPAHLGRDAALVGKDDCSSRCENRLAMPMAAKRRLARRYCVPPMADSPAAPQKMSVLRQFLPLTHGIRSTPSHHPSTRPAMDPNKVAGRCLCGSVVFQYAGTPNWTLHCHCQSCRRATSSPMTTWISVPRSAFSFTKGSPRYFSSSQGVRRGFCDNCGSPLTYESERIADEMPPPCLMRKWCRPADTYSSRNNCHGAKSSMIYHGLQRPVAAPLRPFA